MRSVFSYLQPFLRSFAFFGAYILLMSITGAMLLSVLGVVDPESGAEELQSLEGNSLLLLLMQLASLISVLFSLFIFSRIPPQKDYVSLGITGEHVLKDIGLGALAGAGIIGLAFLVLLATGLITQVEINSLFNARDLLVWLFIYMIVAFVEEVIFRGYFLNLFMDHFSPLASVFITSLLFALIHFLNPSFGWIGFVNIFLAGMLMGVAFFFRRSIWIPLGLHFGWNFFQGTVLGFNVSGIEAENLLHLQFAGSSLLNGGAFGLEGSLITTFICLLVLAGAFYFGNLSFQAVEFEENEPDNI